MRAFMGTRAAAFSSSYRATGIVGAYKLGGNLLKDIMNIRICMYLLINSLGKTTVKTHIPDDLEVDVMKAATMFC